MKQLENKVILVTGANGFIGAHLVARLSKISGVKLLLLSRQMQQSTQQNIIWLKCSLEKLTLEFWSSHGINHIDYVFHLGAFTPKVAAEANKMDRVIDDNIMGTRALLQSLPVNPIKLVFSSTLDVYAQLNDDDVLTEESSVAPSTLYGASKLFCENLIAVWSKERGCSYANLRYGHIYGPGEQRYEKLIPTIIRNLLNNNEPVIYGDGSVLRDYLYIDDAVEATIRASLVNSDIDAVNIVRGESLMLIEIVHILMRLVGNAKKIKLLSDKKNGNSLRFNNKRMTKLLGKWAMMNLAEGLAVEVEQFSRIEPHKNN